MFPLERRFAATAYTRWTTKLTRDGPAQPSLDQRIAINAAYSGAAFLWMAIWVPLILVAAFTFDTNRPFTVALAVAAIVPVTMFIIRILQAVRAYSGRLNS